MDTVEYLIYPKYWRDSFELKISRDILNVLRKIMQQQQKATLIIIIIII